ncbi:hypothetical protein HYQ46_005094 [Verticillium longisporum]|nr:hypothetical protein HYQ46_005094 [Verticillium longisporum]
MRLEYLGGCLLARHKDIPGAQPQRPEDFMDDEDREAALEDEKIQLSEAFTAGTVGGNTRAFGRGLSDLIYHGDASLGLGLLMKMGWREGQGIGPKNRTSLRLMTLP